MNKELEIIVKNRRLIFGPYKSDVITSDDRRCITKVPSKFNYVKEYKNDRLMSNLLDEDSKEIINSLYFQGGLYFHEQLENPGTSFWKDRQRRLLVDFRGRFDHSDLYKDLLDLDLKFPFVDYKVVPFLNYKIDVINCN